jgi:hypothetical protein
VQASITKIPQISQLINKRIHSHSSGGRQSMFKALADSVSDEVPLPYRWHLLAMSSYGGKGK